MDLFSPIDRKTKYFLIVAESLSIAEASRKIGISQPSLSHSLKLLENGIGHRLFDRSVGGIQLTPKGQAYYSLLAKAKRQLDSSLQEIDQIFEDQVIRFGCVAHIASQYVLPHLSKSSSPFRLQFYGTLSFDSLSAVSSGELDAAIISWTKRPRELSYIELWDDPAAVVGLKDRFAHIRNARSIDDLKDEPWIFFPKPEQKNPKSWLHAFEPEKEGYVARDIYAHKSMILSGLGIGDIQTDTFSSEEKKLLVTASIPTYYNPPKAYLIFRKGLSRSVCRQIEAYFAPIIVRQRKRS